MKKMNRLKLATLCVALACFAVSCSNTETEKASATTAPATETAAPMPAKTDVAKLKAEIQALETSWAAADNARDAGAIAAFYADDAVTMSNNKPMLSGKPAIEKDIKESMAKRAKGATIAYDVLNVFGDENTVTEMGKTTVKDAAGKVTYTGKYMAVWQMRNGKYICVADIGNDDVKAK